MDYNDNADNGSVKEVAATHEKKPSTIDNNEKQATATQPWSVNGNKIMSSVASYNSMQNQKFNLNSSTETSSYGTVPINKQSTIDNETQSTLHMNTYPHNSLGHTSIPLPTQERQPLQPSYQHTTSLYPNNNLNTLNNMGMNMDLTEYEEPIQSTYDEDCDGFYSTPPPQNDMTFKKFVSQCATALSAKNLQRSFCFGAIDGLLTGSSITFAAAGLDIFKPTSPLKQRLLIVALIFSACAADGLCMALGHVWSTYIVNETMAQEQKDEMIQFKKNRSETKARMVDALLMRGMLRIDAMSIVDILEGYPDILLGALTGDLHLGNKDNDNNYTDTSNVEYHQMPRVMTTREGQSRYDEDDDEMDFHDYEADAESRNEGIFMMFAFAIFSALPPLVYSFVPNWFNPPVEQFPSFYPYNHGYHEEHNSYKTGASPTSVTITILSCIMLLLGFWKSKFFDSNWIMFGIETILVLICCNIAAYFFASGLRKLIFNDAEPSIL